MRIAGKALNPQEMEYSPASGQMTKKGRKKEESRNEGARNLFSHFPLFLAVKILDRSGRSFLSPAFPQKNRFACVLPPYARDTREHAPAQNRNLCFSSSLTVMHPHFIITLSFFFSTPIFPCFPSSKLSLVQMSCLSVSEMRCL